MNQITLAGKVLMEELDSARLALTHASEEDDQHELEAYHSLVETLLFQILLPSATNPALLLSTVDDDMILNEEFKQVL
jgi:hypothetical protein